MPSTTRGRPSARDRAEARRRARARARGSSPSEEVESADDVSADAGDSNRRPRGLRWLLPSAPPLRGKPDPMAGFSYRGPAPLRPLAVGGHLLRSNPVAWTVPALGWMAGRLVSGLGEGVGFAGALLEIGSLTAAGALGWQRPWLYGAVAGVMGLLLLIGVIIGLNLTAGGALGQLLSGAIEVLLYWGILQALTGALTGWFGGYWRRRMAQIRATPSRPRR